MAKPAKKAKSKTAGRLSAAKAQPKHHEDHIDGCLTKLGIDASGTFDGVTEAAVRRFQSDNGLVADGIVGPRTLATLDG